MAQKEIMVGVSLKEHSAYRIGGEATYFQETHDEEELREAVAFARNSELPHFILGSGTNILIGDEGFKGMVIKPTIRFISAEGRKVRVGAGILMSELLDFAIEHSLAGLEWAGGLPGTVGGATRGNAGAFGGETKDTIFDVISLDISGVSPKVVKRDRKECEFGYRKSVFKERSGKEVILEATFELEHGNKTAIRSSIEEKIRYRKERHPLEYPNIGSIFKNVPIENVPKESLNTFFHVVKTDPFPVVPTAFLLSEVGVKGARVGGAMISEKHPNFIVNTGDASASDVQRLIHEARDAVERKYGITLEEEIMYLTSVESVI